MDACVTLTGFTCGIIINISRVSYFNMSVYQLRYLELEVKDIFSILVMYKYDRYHLSRELDMFACLPMRNFSMLSPLEAIWPRR
jgi:hypothetical protein